MVGRRRHRARMARAQPRMGRQQLRPLAPGRRRDAGRRVGRDAPRGAPALGVRRPHHGLGRRGQVGGRTRCGCHAHHRRDLGRRRRRDRESRRAPRATGDGLAGLGCHRHTRRRPIGAWPRSVRRRCARPATCRGCRHRRRLGARRSAAACSRRGPRARTPDGTCPSPSPPGWPSLSWRSCASSSAPSPPWPWPRSSWRCRRRNATRPCAGRADAPPRFSGWWRRVAVMVAAYAKGLPALPLVLVLVVITAMVWYLVAVGAGIDGGRGGQHPARLHVGGVLGLVRGAAAGPGEFPHRHGIAFLLGAIVATIGADVGALAIGSWLGRHHWRRR